MRKLICGLFFFLLVIAASRGFADSFSNSDFNPFPQMEQDQKNVDDDTAAPAPQDNDDAQQANDDGQANSEDNHD